MSGLLGKVAAAISRCIMDKNEKIFIHNSQFKDSSNLSKKSPEILIQMPVDYFYTCLFSLVGQQSAQRHGARRVGLWPHNILAFNRSNNSVIWFYIQSLYKKIYQFFLRRKWIKIYCGAGVTGSINLDQVGLLPKIKNAFTAHRLWRSLKSKRELLDLELMGLHCGDLIYDSYIRFRAQPTVNLDDPYLKYLIRQCLNAQFRIRKYFAQHRVEVFLSSYSSYIQHGIPLREALRSGVTVYTAGTFSQYLKRVDIENPTHVPDYPNYAGIFALLDDRAGKLNLAKSQLEKRFTGHIDIATRYMQASAYGDNDDYIPADIEGVVFLHDFFDSPHCYRWMLFEDFWEWALFTLQTIQDNGLKLAVKPHPNQIPESVMVIQKLKEKFPDICWISSNISNKAIFASGIHCGISVYGTILHELAYHHIASLAAGDHPHISFQISKTPSTIEEYKNLLINFKSLSVAGNVKEEVLAFYYMHNMHDKESLRTAAPQLELRELDANNSSSLISFLDRTSKLSTANLING